MFKLFFEIMILPFKLILLPLKILSIFVTPTDDNIWGLSKEDKRIAREEGMSDADYIEAEERDDDYLDTDD